MKRSAEDKRRPVSCPSCGHAMVCMNRFESIYRGARGFYIWYVCPRRRGEGGCGYSVLLEVLPKSKRPRRTVIAFQFKRPAPKKEARPKKKTKR